MKRLLCCLAFLIPSIACADLRPPKASGALLSTNTLVAGTTIYTSSGTIQSFNASTATISTKITIPNGAAATDAAAFGQLHLMQAPVTFATSVSSGTAVTSFVATNITATITPTSAASKILILVSGEFSTTTTSVGAFGFFSLNRGTTNIGDATFGFGYVTNFITSAVTPDDYSVSFQTIDAPATTAATTYTVTMKSQASETVTFQRASVPGTITLMEVQ